MVFRELLEDDFLLLLVHRRSDGGTGEHARHQLGCGHRIGPRHQRKVDRCLLAGERVHVGRETLERFGDSALIEIVKTVEEEVLEVMREPAHASRLVLRPGRHGHSDQDRPRTRTRPQQCLRPGGQVALDHSLRRYLFGIGDSRQRHENGNEREDHDEHKRHTTGGRYEHEADCTASTRPDPRCQMADGRCNQIVNSSLEMSGGGWADLVSGIWHLGSERVGGRHS